MDSISTASAPCCQKAVNDDRTVSTVINRMFAQLCLDSNNKVDDPDTLLASFHAMQEINTTVYDDIVGLYVQYSDEVYSNRVQNISNDLAFDKVLQLRAASHVIVRMIQNTCVDCLLRMLFDSGVDRMMMKHLALPPGVNPSVG
jgi:hypothetical protein